MNETTAITIREIIGYVMIGAVLISLAITVPHCFYKSHEAKEKTKQEELNLGVVRDSFYNPVRIEDLETQTKESQ